MTETRIAALIPVYRNQAGLDRTLESLRRAQGEFDVVIVDDGSPMPIAAPPTLRNGTTVHLLRCENNGGITRALNLGLEFIVSRDYVYVARLDSGDTIAPERFDLQSAYLEARSDCAAVSSFVDFVDEKENVLFRHRVATDLGDLAREMHLRNCLLHSGVMLRVAAVAQVGFYDERYFGAEDYELFLRLSRRYRLAVLPKVLTNNLLDLHGLSVRGRRRQQWTRLRCQLRYFDPSTGYSLLGIVRTLAALLAPHALVISWKRARPNS